MFDVTDVVRILVALIVVVAVGYALYRALLGSLRWRARAARAAIYQRLLAEGKVIGRQDAPVASAEREEVAA